MSQTWCSCSWFSPSWEARPLGRGSELPLSEAAGERLVLKTRGPFVWNVEMWSKPDLFLFFFRAFLLASAGKHVKKRFAFTSSSCCFGFFAARKASYAKVISEASFFCKTFCIVLKPQISKAKVFTGCMTSPEHGLVYGEGDADIETLGRASGHVFPPFWRRLKSPFF